MTDEFVRNVVKGKIIETIFYEMFLSTGKFDVIPLSYEYLHPTVAQLKKSNPVVKEALKSISSMPDFLLVSKDDNQAYLVEVKYRNEITLEDIKDVARAVLEKHKYPWLFVASKTGFFFDSCNNILNYHEPTPNPLNESWVDSNTQNEFLTILNEFIG